jgi:hypothetical protein
VDILDKLRDLHRQATTERSHYYVASCCNEAIGEIERLRAVVDSLFASATEARNIVNRRNAARK